MTNLDPRRSDREAETIGEALLNLSARLPDGYCDLQGHGAHDQATMYVSYDAGDEVWEIEFCALDPSRNFTMQDGSLEALATRSIERDREAAPDV